jgi:hypothetical protein
VVVGYVVIFLLNLKCKLEKYIIKNVKKKKIKKKKKKSSSSSFHN